MSRLLSGRTSLGFLFDPPRRALVPVAHRVSGTQYSYPNDPKCTDWESYAYPALRLGAVQPTGGKGGISPALFLKRVCGQVCREEHGPVEFGFLCSDCPTMLPILSGKRFAVVGVSRDPLKVRDGESCNC